MRDIHLSATSLTPLLIAFQVARQVTDLNTERPGSRIEETYVRIKAIKRFTIEDEDYPGLRVVMGIDSVLQLRQITATAPILGPIDVPVYPFVANLIWGRATDTSPDYVEGEATRGSTGAFVINWLTGYAYGPATADNPRELAVIYTHTWPAV